MLLPQILFFSLASQSLQQPFSTSEGRPPEENEAVPEEEYKEGVEPEPESKKRWSISRKTVKHILELLCDESVSWENEETWGSSLAADVCFRGWGLVMSQYPLEVMS